MYYEHGLEVSVLVDTVSALPVKSKVWRYKLQAIAIAFCSIFWFLPVADKSQERADFKFVGKVSFGEMFMQLHL